MALWQETMDEIDAIVRDAEGKDEEEELSFDRRIAIAQVHATLSLAEVLSRLITQQLADNQARHRRRRQRHHLVHVGPLRWLGASPGGQVKRLGA